MKAKTARPFLLVMLFGFLASNGWMITEYGPGTSDGGIAPPSAALGTSLNAAHATRPVEASALPLQRIIGAGGTPATTTARTGGAAASPPDWLPAESSPTLASATPVNPADEVPNDLTANLAFPGATNLGSSSDQVPGGLPAGPPAVGAGPGSAATPPPVPGGGPHTKELAEPGSLALLAAGLIVLGLMRRRARAG